MPFVFGFGRRLFDSIVKTEIVQLRYKRRRVAPSPWIPPVYGQVRTQLYQEDRELVEEKLRNDPTWQPRHNVPLRPDKQGHVPFHLIPGVKNVPDNRGNVYNMNTTKRIGMVGRKIGMTLQWMKDGTRCLCTMIHFPQNVVLSANDSETWYRHSPTGKLKGYWNTSGGRLKPRWTAGPRWSQMVGAMDYDSVFLSKPYREIFQRAGVTCKKFLGGFLVSKDAVVKPGTPLDVRHFQVGQYVTVCGKSIDWGFQGVMHRWGMRGMPRRRTTKAHRRVGCIGHKGEAKVWLGRALPGHMGYQWSRDPGLLVLRINPIEQVIYVRGPVPGDIGEMLLMTDCMIEEKRTESLPFPTFCPEENDFLTLKGEEKEELHKIYSVTSHDLYHPRLFKMNQTSIIYTASDETHSKVRDKSRAKTAQVKKN